MAIKTPGGISSDEPGSIRETIGQAPGVRDGFADRVEVVADLFEDRMAHPRLAPTDRRQTGTYLSEGDFSCDLSEAGMRMPDRHRKYLRPLVMDVAPGPDADSTRARGDEPDHADRVSTRIIPSSAKAACIPLRTDIDGVVYRYVQYKGVGRNAGAPDASITGNASSHFPLFNFVVHGVERTRFLGGALYSNLLYEQEQQEEVERVTKGKIRVPKILATVEFSEALCQREGLPLPGENLESYEKRVTMLPGKRLAFDAEHYGSDAMALGQNIRAFRDPVRIQDLEMLTRSTTEESRRSIEVHIDNARSALSEEDGAEITREQYPLKLASILGAQAALLTKHGILKGSMVDLRQDITLAGELCDFDVTGFVEDYSTVWEQDGPKEWETERAKLVEQLFLVANHLTVFPNAYELLGIPLDTERMYAAFCAGFLSSLKSSRKSFKRFSKYFSTTNVEDVLWDKEQNPNFSNCESAFRLIHRLLVEGCASPAA